MLQRGNTSLHIAVRDGNPLIIQTILTSGGDLDIHNKVKSQYLNFNTNKILNLHCKIGNKFKLMRTLTFAYAIGFTNSLRLRFRQK